jgi:glucose-1-phosphate cytidylyltransferase
VDVQSLVAFHRGHGLTGTVTAVHPPGRFGELEMRGTCVTEFSEKPLLSHGRINAGFFVFRREFLDRLHDVESLVLEHGPLQQLAREGPWLPMRTTDSRIRWITAGNLVT